MKRRRLLLPSIGAVLLTLAGCSDLPGLSSGSTTTTRKSTVTSTSTSAASSTSTTIDEYTKNAMEAFKKIEQKFNEHVAAGKLAVGDAVDFSLNHPEADLKGVFRMYAATLGALLGHEARAGRLKVQLPVKATKGKPKDPDDSDGPIPMDSTPKGTKPGSGTPIHADATPPKPAATGAGTGGMGKGSLIDDESDTIGLAPDDDKPVAASAKKAQPVTPKKK